MSLAAVNLHEVLLRPDVWRGDRLATAGAAVVASGFAALDAELPGGGWPQGGLTELMPATQGIGEISLLLPALRQLDEGRIGVLAPRGLLPHAPGWAACLPLSRLLWVEAEGDDIAWSAELLLASGGLGALLVWLPARTSNKSLRRLQLAIEGRQTLAFLFRAQTDARSASPAILRLALSGSRQGLQVDLLKRRGPPCERTLLLPVARPLAWARAPAQPRLYTAQRPPQRLQAVDSLPR